VPSILKLVAYSRFRAFMVKFERDRLYEVIGQTTSELLKTLVKSILTADLLLLRSKDRLMF